MSLLSYDIWSKSAAVIKYSDYETIFHTFSQMFYDLPYLECGRSKYMFAHKTQIVFIEQFQLLKFS